MELILIVASFATLAGVAGIVYPFRPFGKRRNAFFTVIGSIVVAISAAPAPQSGGTTSLAAAIEQNLNEAEEPVVPQATTVATAPKLDTQARARDRQDEILEKAGILQWKNARNLYVRLNNAGNADEEFKAELEAKVLEIVRPLPASARETNLEGYELLAAIRPENSEYRDKVENYKQAIIAARELAVARLQTSRDKVEGITWYQHPNKPRYLNSRSTAYLYIGKKDASRPWLRMKVIYTADTWLFVNKVTAWHDGIKEPLISGIFERDNNHEIWEWMDVTPDAYQIEVLRSLSNANEAILRFEGQQYRRDVTLSAGDKKAIREMLEAYEAMRGGS